MIQKNNSFRGYLYIIQAFLAWGVLAIYWKSLKHVNAWELLANRIIWSFIILVFWLYATRKLQFKKLWNNKKHRYALLATSILIGLNWGFFIYAVNTNKIVQASLGYYITPIVNMFLGIVILKEKLTRLKITALTIVFSAVTYLTMQSGEFPFISFILAFSFGFYGLLKKTTPVETLPSLSFETAVLSPAAIIFLIYSFNNPTFSTDTYNFSTILLLMGTGIITILPLYWFTKGAKLTDLTTVGFFQYIAPTMMLFIGVIIYHEPFKTEQLIAFTSIWMAIGIYIYSLINNKNKKTANN